MVDPHKMSLNSPCAEDADYYLKLGREQAKTKADLKQLDERLTNEARSLSGKIDRLAGGALGMENKIDHLSKQMEGLIGMVTEIASFLQTRFPPQWKQEE